MGTDGQRVWVLNTSPSDSDPLVSNLLAGWLGAVLANGGSVITLLVVGPVSPGPVASLVLVGSGVVWPGLLGLLAGAATHRWAGGDRRRAWLLGSIVAAMSLAASPWMWLYAAAASGVLWLQAPRRYAISVMALGSAAALMLLGGALLSHRRVVGPSILLVTVAQSRAQSDVSWRSLELLRSRGTAFDSAMSSSSSEAQALTALLSGTAPWHTTPNEPLAAVLSSAGLHTAAFVRSPVVSRGSGLLHGFDRVDAELTWLVGATHSALAWLLARGEPRRRADGTVDRAVWWFEQGKEHSFVWVHLDDLAGPLDPPPPFDERYSQLDAEPVAHSGLELPLPTTVGELLRRYNGTQAFVDHELYRLLGAVSERQDWVVVVVGVTGTALREGAAWGAPSAEPSSWAVPLVIVGPKVAAGVVVSEPVETLDLSAWLASLHGVGDGGPVASALATGRSASPVARSVSLLSTGWVASVANSHGRSTVGAHDSWVSHSPDSPERAMRSLLEASTMRVLLGVRSASGRDDAQVVAPVAKQATAE